MFPVPYRSSGQVRIALVLGLAFTSQFQPSKVLKLLLNFNM